MADHRLRIVQHFGNLRLVCSCPSEPLWYGMAGQGISLTEINEIAHEHIVAAEEAVAARRITGT